MSLPIHKQKEVHLIGWNKKQNTQSDVPRRTAWGVFLRHDLPLVHADDDIRFVGDPGVMGDVADTIAFLVRQALKGLYNWIGIILSMPLK
jgi:hypothetical protein